MGNTIKGRTHTRDSAMAAIARKGLKVMEVGATNMKFIDIDDGNSPVGNKTLGVLDYLSGQHKIRYGRTTRDKQGRVTKMEIIN